MGLKAEINSAKKHFDLRDRILILQTWISPEMGWDWIFIPSEVCKRPKLRPCCQKICFTSGCIRHTVHDIQRCALLDVLLEAKVTSSDIIKHKFSLQIKKTKTDVSVAAFG